MFIVLKIIIGKIIRVKYKFRNLLFIIIEIIIRKGNFIIKFEIKNIIQLFKKHKIIDHKINGNILVLIHININIFFFINELL